ncbi:MAG: hypothetical protein LWW85_04495 [Marinilabiliales bacterium]|nr:hypothetical protein [Marinilabiliales bacterium]
MKRQLLYFLLVSGIVSVLFTSCNKTIVDDQIYIDSYIHAIYNKNHVPVYRVMHTAYSFNMLTSVTVKGSSGSSVSLKNFDSNMFSFYTPLDTAQYSTTIPQAEVFTYNIVNDKGANITLTNGISGQSLIPAPSLKAEKNSTDIVLSWKAVPNVEAYKIRIFSENITTKEQSMIFESDYLKPKDPTSDLSLPFSLISYSPYLSTNLTFEVASFIFESQQSTFHAVSAASVKGYYGD